MGGEKTGFRGFGGFGFGKFRLGLGWVAGTGWLGVELLGLIDGFGFGFGFCFSGFGLGWVWLGWRGEVGRGLSGVGLSCLVGRVILRELDEEGG